MLRTEGTCGDQYNQDYISHSATQYHIFTDLAATGIYIVQATDEAIIQQSVEETTMGIYIIKSRDASDSPEDIGIVLEGQRVLQNLDNYALAAAMLFGLMFTLNLTYPPELKYTFILEKLVVELEGNSLSKKAPVLRNRVYK
ncbi:unnamed protein product [Oreochromis niloticus]|nr:unnamed protein product [Mustela putorius furo]